MAPRFLGAAAEKYCTPMSAGIIHHYVRQQQIRTLTRVFGAGVVPVTCDRRYPPLKFDGLAALMTQMLRIASS